MICLDLGRDVVMYCPKCGGEMGMRDVKCPHCAYDFPVEREEDGNRAGLAYSGFSYVVLALAIVACILAFAGTAITCAFWALDRWPQRSDDWIKLGFAALFELTMLFVLLRVYDMRPSK